MGTEIVYALVALFGVGGFIALVRRASQKQISGSKRGVQQRLRATGADEDDDARETATPQDSEESEHDLDASGAHEADSEADSEDGGRSEDDTGDGEDDAQEALKAGLARTRGGFVSRLGKLFARKTIDDDLLEEVEQVLFEADIGPKTAERIFATIKSALSKDELTDPEAIWTRIRDESATILDVPAAPLDFSSEKPFVLLVIGVNGVGKTTTIGKLAAKLTREGKKVLLAAGDTFRAAAVEQLEVWADRANADIVRGKSNGDPSSVIFDAIKKGEREGYDVVIADTAGRLHTKVELMDELEKVGRVCKKALPGAPHETWLVLDSTTGQNAIQQAQLFTKAVSISGLVLTKLDGTAKGGVILGICDEMKTPVRYIGIGEQVDDLRTFDPKAFVRALYESEEDADKLAS